MTLKVMRRMAYVCTLGIVFSVGISIAVVPDASARFGGGYGGDRHYGGGGGGWRGSGGDGFGGGSFGRSSYGGSSSYRPSGEGSSSYHPSSGSGSSYNDVSHPNSSQNYSTYTANQQEQQQARYNEANTLQSNQEETEEHEHNQSVNAAYNINNNNISTGHTNSYYGGSYYGPYGNCCSSGGSNTGEVLGAAALGAVGGMAVGSMITANTQNTAAPAYGYAPPPAYPPPVGTMVYALPAGAYSASINGGTYYVANGVYYKAFYSGSQVVYMVSQPYG